MTIAVGGNIGAMIELREALVNTQDIMTTDLKFAIAVSAWNDDAPLRDGSGGLVGPPVKVKISYPLKDNRGDPTYLITDLNGKILMNGAVPKYYVDPLRGDIWLGPVPNPYPGTDPAVTTGPQAYNPANFANRLGRIRFRVRDAAALTEHSAEIQSLNVVIDTLSSIIGMFQKQETAFLNSGAIS